MDPQEEEIHKNLLIKLGIRGGGRRDGGRERRRGGEHEDQDGPLGEGKSYLD